MKFNELTIGKKYIIDNAGAIGTLQEGIEGLGPGFELENTELPYSLSVDGLVRFGEHDDWNYQPITPEITIQIPQSIIDTCEGLEMDPVDVFTGYLEELMEESNFKINFENWLWEQDY